MRACSTHKWHVCTSRGRGGCQRGALNETSGAGHPRRSVLYSSRVALLASWHTHTHLELLPPRIPAHTLQLPCLLSRRHRHWAAVGVAGNTRASRSDSVWPCLAAVMCGWLAAAGWSPVVAAALRGAAQLCAGANQLACSGDSSGVGWRWLEASALQPARQRQGSAGDVRVGQHSALRPAPGAFAGPCA